MLTSAAALLSNQQIHPRPNHTQRGTQFILDETRKVSSVIDLTSLDVREQNIAVSERLGVRENSKCRKVEMKAERVSST